MTKIFDIKSSEGYLYIIDKDASYTCKLDISTSSDGDWSRVSFVYNTRSNTFHRAFHRVDYQYGIVASNNPYLIGVPGFEIEENDELLTYINTLENGLFTGWSEREVNAYKTALLSIKEKYKSIKPIPKQVELKMAEMIYSDLAGNFVRSAKSEPEIHVGKVIINKLIH